MPQHGDRSVWRAWLQRGRLVPLPLLRLQRFRHLPRPTIDAAAVIAMAYTTTAGEAVPGLADTGAATPSVAAARWSFAVAATARTAQTHVTIATSVAAASTCASHDAGGLAEDAAAAALRPAVAGRTPSDAALPSATTATRQAVWCAHHTSRISQHRAGSR